MDDCPDGNENEKGDNRVVRHLLEDEVSGVGERVDFFLLTLFWIFFCFVFVFFCFFW